MPELANVTWTRDLARLVENRSSKRSAVLPNQGQAWRLTGIDGFSRAGIRPMAGFRKLAGDLNLNLAGGHFLNRGDFWVVTLPVDSDTAFTGYVYRYRTGPSGTYQVKFRWYDGSNQDPHPPLVGWRESSHFFNTDDPDPMDVAVVGRVLYVFVKGQKPAALYFDEDEELVVINDTGPGPNPSSFKIGALNSTSFLTTSTCLNNEDNSDTTLNDVVQGRIIVNEEIDVRGSDYPTYKAPVASGSNKPTGETPLKYAPGSYSFAFELVDSRTNRKSQLSEIMELEPEDFNGAVTVTTSTVYNVGKRSYILFEVLVDTTKYNQCYLYRSVRNPPNTTAGPLQSALFLEAVLTSENNKYVDTDLDTKTSSPNFERWFFYCVLDDQALLVQDPYFNRVVVDTEMPRGGAAISYENIMIVSDIGGVASDPAPNQSNVGEIRYSSTLLVSPESFPPNNRNVPPALLDTPIAWVQAAGNALGLSKSRAYFTRASGGFIEFEPIANGFGLESRRGLASIAELVFYVSSTGMKVINSTGRLDAMAAFDNVIQDDWKTTRASVFMVYDPDSKVLWTINPDTREGLLVWMETNTPSSVVDLPFIAASSGLVPDATDGVERAQFVTPEGFIYVYDRERTKVDGSGGRRTALLDWSGPGHVTISVVGSPTGGVYPVTFTGGTLPTDGSLNNAFVYVTTGPRRGEKYRVTTVNTGTTFELTSAEGLNPTGLVGQTLAISPVFVRWVDAPIDVQSPDGFQFGLSERFRQRSVSTMSVYFSDAIGPSAETTRAIYSATLWRGNLTETYTWGIPLDNDRQVVPSIVDHNPEFASAFQYDSNLPVVDSVIAPGLDIFVTDLDFLAVAARIAGTIQHTSRGKGP